MTNKIFQMWCPESTIPLTVIAGDFEEAELTYLEWVCNHHPAWSKEAARVEQVSEDWQADRPQLAAALEAAADSSGNFVVYWRNHRKGWIPRPTYCDPAGTIAPVEPLIRFYDVTSEDGAAAMVFALDRVDAIRLYTLWHERRFGFASHRYMIGPVSRWLLIGDKVTLREEMDLGATGIAGRSLTSGWHIYPPDHEMAGA